MAEGGFMFHGPLHFGSSQIGFDVVYDSGSDWVVIEGSGCSNCQGDTYNSALSINSKKVGTTVSSRQYGTAILYGTEYVDKVCINNNNGCVDNFLYF